MNYPESEPDEQQRIAEEGRLLIGILLLLMPNGSRKALAARSGVSRRALSLYERGARRPQQRTRQRLAEAVNVDLAAVEALFPAFERLRAIARGERRVDGDGDGLGGIAALAQSIGEAVRERVEAEGATITLQAPQNLLDCPKRIERNSELLHPASGFPSVYQHLQNTEEEDTDD